MDAYPQPTSTRRRKLLIFASVAVLIITTITLFSSPSLPSPSSFHVPYCTMESRAEVTFSKRPEFFDLTPSGDSDWTALLPPNGGFIVQKNPGGDYEMAGVTMFHQLHCLSMIRAAVQDMRAGRTPMRRDDGRKHPDEEHWVHCLDYLMQGILCAADDTIEPAHEGIDGERTVDGYGVTHVCRDPAKLWHRLMGEKSRPGWEQRSPKAMAEEMDDDV